MKNLVSQQKIEQRSLWWPKRKKNDEGVTTRPVVSCQHDVCEKLEQHFCAVDHDDMKEYWHSWCV